MTPGPREGDLVTIEGRPALRFQRRYPHPIERVWRAVTDPGEMGLWFPSQVIGERTVGAELRFEDDDHRAEAEAAGEPTRAEGPILRGTVLAVEAPHVFAFSWGGEILRFELRAEGAHTVLTFTQLLSHQSVAARNGAGWHACLLELDRLLGDADGGVAEDWQAVYADYLDRIGPELGTPSGNGTLVWERATHVDPARVQRAVSDAAEVAAWAGDAVAGASAADLTWEVEPAEVGSRLRVLHPAVDGDADRAARWHAALVQLDMYLAAGQLVPVDHQRWVEPYRVLLRPESDGRGDP